MQMQKLTLTFEAPEERLQLFRQKVADLATSMNVETFSFTDKRGVSFKYVRPPGTASTVLIDLIKAVRDHRCCGLREAKDCVESGSVTLIVSAELVDALYTRIAKNGVEVVYLTPGEVAAYEVHTT